MSHKQKAEPAKKPKESAVLKKFDKLRQRQKPLYTKAFELIKNTTLVLEEAKMNVMSPTAYLASLLQLLQTLPAGQTALDLEVVAYCFAAVLSMVELAVIQNQHAQIFQVIKNKLLCAEVSETTCKYGLLALQFLLHSKTYGQWQTSMLGTQAACPETAEAVSLMLASLVDLKR